jgi:hypothetical protein
MTDIVERLRDRSLVIQYPERERIANEIERLRGIMATCEWCGPDVGADQPAVPLRELCDIAYDHLLAAGYPKDGPVLTQIATGCTPDQQSARKGLDELTRMAQEDGLYDMPPDKT